MPVDRQFPWRAGPLSVRLVHCKLRVADAGRGPRQHCAQNYKLRWLVERAVAYRDRAPNGSGTRRSEDIFPRGLRHEISNWTPDSQKCFSLRAILLLFHRSSVRAVENRRRFEKQLGANGQGGNLALVARQ